MQKELFMTSMQIDQVQSTWQKVMPFREDIAVLFYRRLFEIEPELSMVFKGDMHDYLKKIMFMIDLAILNLGQLERVMPMLQEMANKYVQCGMKVDSNAVRNTFISILERHLSETFTGDIRSDWIQTYDVLVGVVKDAVTEKVTYGFTD
ncbi:MAG: globin domain-containing protein [Methylotenera sp.]